MGLLNRLYDQVNMFDGGKAFNSAPQKAQQIPQATAQPMQPIHQGGNAGPEMYDNPDYPTGNAPMPPNRMGGPGLRVGQSQQQSMGQARPNFGMQMVGQFVEDDYTPSAAVEKTGYFNPQTTQHSQYMHQGGYNPQTTLDGGLTQELRRRLGI